MSQMKQFAIKKVVKIQEKEVKAIIFIFLQCFQKPVFSVRLILYQGAKILDVFKIKAF